jgi:hypothetical protein
MISRSTCQGAAPSERGRHHRQYRAGNGKVHIAHEQPGHRIGEHDPLAHQRHGDIADQALAARQYDHQEADHHPWKGERQGQQGDQRGAAGEGVALQENSGDAADEQGRAGGGGGQGEGGQQREKIRAIGQDRRVGDEAAATADQE